jgi:hypothetical protein
MNINHLTFKGLFDIWKGRNYDLYFYFQEIFEKALAEVLRRADNASIGLQEEDVSRYRALFVPVGLSIENVALIAALIKPDYLHLAFTETSRYFHRKHRYLVEENIKKHCQGIRIVDSTVVGDDQRHVEQNILEWVDEMKTGYGMSYKQLAIDLTGGTKPMSIGAHNAALSFDEIDAFYLRSDFDEETKEPMPGTETLIRLKKEKSQVDHDFIFVIMPFSAKYDEVYHWIEETAREANMTCLRADKEIFIGGIMDKVKENILKAGILIAELSEKNPNVYYELGLAHASSKKVLMLTQNIDNIPFDLKHLRMVIYNSVDKDSFIERLSREIESIRNLP